MDGDPFIKPRKNTWVIPLAVLIMGVFHFTNYSYDVVQTPCWYVLIPLALLFFVIGIFQHWRVTH